MIPPTRARTVNWERSNLAANIYKVSKRCSSFDDNLQEINRLIQERVKKWDVKWIGDNHYPPPPGIRTVAGSTHWTCIQQAFVFETAGHKIPFPLAVTFGQFTDFKAYEIVIEVRFPNEPDIIQSDEFRYPCHHLRDFLQNGVLTRFLQN